MLFCNCGSKTSLTKELIDFVIPSLGGDWNAFHPVDSIRRPYGDSCMEIVDDGGSMGGGVELSFNNF